MKVTVEVNKVSPNDRLFIDSSSYIVIIVRNTNLKYIIIVFMDNEDFGNHYTNNTHDTIEEAHHYLIMKGYKAFHGKIILEQ